MAECVHPGDLVWVAPDTSMYHTPDVFDPIEDDTIRLTAGWSLALVIGTRIDGWTVVLHADELVFVGTRCLMSIDVTPSTILNR